MKRLALLLPILLLAGCAPLDDGYIRDKRFEPENWYPVLYCAMYNNKGMCTLWLNRMEYDDPDWLIQLELKERTGWRKVTQEEYDSVTVGEWYQTGEVDL